MKTLFLLSATAFAVSAIAWYFTWAIWIHAPNGWYDRKFGPLAIARRGGELARTQLLWYRALQIVTILLFIKAATIFVGWIVPQG